MHRSRPSYHEVLGIDSGASAKDVKQAFRRLALKKHPLCHRANSKAASTHAEFAHICEAYDVLSHPTTYGLYNLYGEDGLKSGKHGQAYRFDAATDSPRVFSSFFGTDNPFEAIQGLSESFTTAAAPQPSPKPAAQEVAVSLSLEEVFTGCTKEVRVPSSGPDQVFMLSVPPGVAEGAAFTFPAEDASKGDVRCLVSSAPHPTFKRQGEADLCATVALPLLQALTGTVASLQTLDGRVLSLPVTGVVAPGSSMTLGAEGLPKQGPGEEAERGDLHITFDVTFPLALSEQQRGLIKAALLLPLKMGPAQAFAVNTLLQASQDPRAGWQTGVALPQG